MARLDDLAPLLIPGRAEGVGFRQGVVLSYNSATGANTVRVAGGILTDVPLLNTSEALLLTPGAVVGLLTAGGAWFVLGRVTVPGTPEALSALSALATATAEISTTETRTAGTGYGDLATVGPEVTVTVPPSGRLLVTIGASIVLTVPAGSTINTCAGYMTARITAGPDTGKQLAEELYFKARYAMSAGSSTMALTPEVGASRVGILSGLTPGGVATVTAKYLALTNDVSFYDRNLSVITF